MERESFHRVREHVHQHLMSMQGKQSTRAQLPELCTIHLDTRRPLLDRMGKGRRGRGLDIDNIKREKEGWETTCRTHCDGHLRSLIHFDHASSILKEHHIPHKGQSHGQSSGVWWGLLVGNVGLVSVRRCTSGRRTLRVSGYLLVEM